MTKNQLSAALTLAQSKEPLDSEDTNLFLGFALKDFKAIYCTIRQLASLIRWQTCNLDGTIDQAALNEIAYWGSKMKRFMVV